MNSDAKTASILQIENNESDAALVESLFAGNKDMSFKFSRVHSLAEALDFINKEKVDVILLNLSLPDGPVLDTLFTLASHYMDTPIIVLTDAYSDLLGIKAIDSGAQDCLVKDHMLGSQILRAIRHAIERQRIRSSHLQAQERFSKIFHKNPLPICISRLSDGKILDANTRFCDFLGYKWEEVVGRTAVELGVFADRVEREKAFAKLKKDGFLHNYEFKIKIRSGEVRDVILSDEVMALGEESVYIVMITDISERKRASEELSESEQRFRQMAENIHEVFWMTDVEKNKMIYISPGYEEIWGRTCESLYASPQNWMQAISPDDRSRVLKSAMNNQVAGTYNEEYKIIRPDGAIRWIWDRAFPVKDAAGKVYRVVGIAEDITQAKAAQEALRKEEGRLRLILEQIPAIVWSLDKEYVITSSIGLGLNALGLKADELVGKTLWEYMGTKDEENPTAVAIKKALAGETVSLDSDTNGISFQSRFQPLKNAKGVISGVAAVSINVTDRKVLEDQFRQSQKMEAVGRLAGGVAHDFNNILNIIIGYADMLLTSREEATWAEDVEEIRKAAKRAAGLTHQLLAFSRQQTLQPRVLNMNEEIEDIGKMLSRLMGEDIRWDMSLAPDLWLVRTDPSQIQQVIINLAVNARDAMPKGGSFSIKTFNTTFYEFSSHAYVPPGEYVTLVVSDTGVGMSLETKLRAFEPFYTTKEKGKGTGLGLSLVYGVIKQSKGFITIDSEVGRGTTFTMYLPKTNENLKKEGMPKALPPMNGKLETILVVEDEIPVQRLVSRILSRNGFKVLLAGSGQEALNLATTHGSELTLVLTDIVLPDLRGDEVAKRILTGHPGLKVLYMSGYVDRDFGELSIDAAAAFLQKPFTPDALASKVRSVLDAR